MNRLFKAKLNILTISLCLLLSACSGLLDGIRSGWAGVKPFVQVLVTQQVITQEKANAAIRDIDDVLIKAGDAEQCIKNITSEGNAKKVAKAQCYYTFAQDFRAILARHNIGGNPRLDQIAAIGQGFIMALEEYFHRVTGGPRARGMATPVADPDKALEDAIKARREELKAITGK